MKAKLVKEFLVESQEDNKKQWIANRKQELIDASGQDEETAQQTAEADYNHKFSFSN